MPIALSCDVNFVILQPTSKSLTGSTFAQEGFMRYQFSRQFNTVAVVVEPEDTDPQAVIDFADAIDARAYEGPDLRYVIDFQNDPDRRVGPELYSADALRKSFK